MTARRAGLILQDAGVRLLCCALCACSVVATVPGKGRVVIIRGGTYHGDWCSPDPDLPVVDVVTSEPVVLDHCRFSGRGDLIRSRFRHSDITIRDCVGTGENPNLAGRSAGRFLEDESFDRVRVEHCDMDHTAGIYLRDFQGDRTGRAPTIGILCNAVTDIDGRKSDGAGGYLPFNLRTNRKGGQTEAGFDLVQFVQLDGIHSVPGVDVGWNHVVNHPGTSRVEDNISIYNSSGTADSPIRIHDNCIRGAYTIRPERASSSDGIVDDDWSYSGGGIMLGDGSPRRPEDLPAFVTATGNVVIATTNYGIAISAGHDIVFEHNTIVSGGLLADGRKIAAQNVGAYVWCAAAQNRARGMFLKRDGGRDNTIGWNGPAGRNDAWVPDAAFWTVNTSMPEAVDGTTEASCEQAWVSNARHATGGIGPRPGTGGH
jgi:hypothetical protein